MIDQQMIPIAEPDPASQQESRERRAGIGGWTLSLALHALLLLILALVVIVRPLMVDQPPLRTAYLSPTEPPERPEPKTELNEVEVEVEVETEVTDATVAAAEFELQDITIASDDAAAVSENQVAVAMAIGAGSSGGGGGGQGAFMPGGGGGDGGAGGFFGVGEGGGPEATRICYIIDMSKSLKEAQVALIKDRLLNSLADLSKKQRFEVLFYSGPVWQLGDDPNAARNGWINRGWHDFTPPGPLPEGQWRAYPPSVRAQTERYVMDDLFITGGTDWRHPFSIALQMYPQPEVIFFLTDGKVDNSDETIDLIQTHVEEGAGPVINTIAFGLDDDDGVQSLKDMSTMTGGEHIGYSMQEIEELYHQLMREGKRR